MATQRRIDAAFIAAETGSAPTDALAAAAAERAAEFDGGDPPAADAYYLDWYAWALARRRQGPDQRPASFETPAAAGSSG